MGLKDRCNYFDIYVIPGVTLVLAGYGGPVTFKRYFNR